MHLTRSLALAGLVLAITTGLALAAPVKLSSVPLARGSWDRADRTLFLAALAGQGNLATSDVFIVKATLGPSDSTDPRPGATDWHTHTGPSVVVVTQGTLSVSMPMPGGRCMTHAVGAGEAFFHTTGPHNFINDGATMAEFYVAYFVPAGPPLVPAGDPGC
ncbi:MAG: hypothetical protein ACRDHD_05625 [Candidatus Limnocylindria bacterium]